MATGGSEVSGSDSYRADQTQHCQPCESDGDTVPAVGYCRDCRELLCQRCYDGHRLPSVTRKHELVGIDKIGDGGIDNTQDEARCQQHSGKVIEYHCPVHAACVCPLCFFQDHKSCQGVKYIPDVATDVTSSEEFRQFNSRLAANTSKCRDLLAKAVGCLETVESCHTKVIADFRSFKQEVLEELERLEREMMQKADSYKQDESVKMTTLKERVDRLSSGNELLTSQLASLQDQRQYCDLYRAIVQSQEKLVALEKDIQDANDSFVEKKIRFSAILEVLENLKPRFGLKARFGLDLIRVTSDARQIKKLEHVRDISVKSSSDASACRITCMIQLSQNKVALTDCGNKKVKICDVEQNKVVSELCIPTTSPYGICQVSDNQLAVALLGERLAFMRLEPSLAVEREISVSGRCRAVGCHDSKLVVGYDKPNKLEIIDMQGVVLKEIKKDENGRALFKSPVHVCIDPQSGLVYVSNFRNNELLCLKLDGTVVRRYTDRKLQGPFQMTVDIYGTVYLCGRYSGNVHQLTRDCKKVGILLTKNDGVTEPEFICYSKRGDRVYVGQFEDDNIKVYEIKYLH